MLKWNLFLYFWYQSILGLEDFGEFKLTITSRKTTAFKINVVLRFQATTNELRYLYFAYYINGNYHSSNFNNYDYITCKDL